jgi:ketosteroid isomerase-like protein
MSSADNAAATKEIVRGFFADIAKGDVQRALGRMAEDLKCTLIGATKASGVSGAGSNSSSA